MNPNGLRWRRIAAVSAASIAVALALAVPPLAQRAWRDRDAARLQARYATGLSPCPRMVGPDAAAWRAQAAPGADVIVEIRPDDGPVRIIALDGARLRDRMPAEDRAGTAPAAPGSQRTLAFPAPLARRLRDTLDGDIAQASAQPPWALDGTGYRFLTASGGCATAHAPRPGTRADRWVTLAHALADGASAPPGTDAARRWDAAARALDALRAR